MNDHYLSSTDLSQASSDSQYKRYLRTLRQVQNKRAAIIEKLHYQAKVVPVEPTGLEVKEPLKEANFGPYNILTPSRLPTPVLKTQHIDVTVCDVKPKPRPVCVVTAVQYHEVVHSPSQLPPKKRQYIPTQEDTPPVQKAHRDLYESLVPSQSFSPVQKAENHGSFNGVVKPKPRRVSVVMPVQYHERKICHSVVPALRRPPESSRAANTDSPRLPPKKRRYSTTVEDVAPVSKVAKMADINHSETSAFTSYRPPIGFAKGFQKPHREVAKVFHDNTRKDVSEENISTGRKSIAVFVEQDKINLTSHGSEDKLEASKIEQGLPEISAKSVSIGDKDVIHTSGDSAIEPSTDDVNDVK